MALELPAHAAAHPARVAFGLADGPARTYADLDDRSARLAGVLHAAGLRPGDVLALALGNRVEWAELAWAGLRSGLRVAPVSAHLTAPELERLLAAARPAALITGPPCHEAVTIALDDPAPLVLHVEAGPGEELEAALSGAVRLDAEHERLGARLVYSGGTTGPPKAIREPLPEPAADGSWPIRLAPLMSLLGIDAGAVVLSPGPCYHSAPFGFMATVHRLGGSVLTQERFDAAGCLRAVLDHGVTHLHLVPTMLVRLLRLPEKDRSAFARAATSLQAVVLGGGACGVDVKREATAWLGPLLHEYYGASEGYGQTHAGPADAAERPGTVGRAVRGRLHVTDPDGVELAAGQTGRVWFSGTAPVSYDGDPERTAAARNERGWSTVGDLGHLDADGYLFLDGREGLTIVTGGVNVFPQEIEDVLLAHPDVADAAVFGVPDPEWGERVVALVEPAAAAPPPDLDGALREHCRAHLAPAKRPRALRTDLAIPRSPAGKLRVADARTLYQEPTPA